MRAPEHASSEQPAAPRADLREWNDARLVVATLEHDQVAWRELMRRYAGALREAARDASDTASETDADDAVAELWLSLIENGMRRLRAFDPSRGASLLSWLTIRLAQLVYGRERQRAAEPETVSLTHASKIPEPRSQLVPSSGDRTLMRVEEVARRWGLDRKTIYAMIDRGQITARRCGRLVRIPLKVIESFESQASVAPERHIKCR